MNGRQLLALLAKPRTDRVAVNDNTVRPVEAQRDMFGEEGSIDERRRPNRRKMRKRRVE
ncbi:hypothetical protein [Bosea sp. Root381]|uniref:hypothetical protein n=1 Tax=Bosea sp. Root381 TaxID=1736524 RepID=UPI0012E347AF|nr:hypothetical protein [Bosea sp. Root381]